MSNNTTDVGNRDIDKGDLETRVRDHLDRVAATPARVGLSERVLAHVDSPRQSNAAWAAAAAVLVVVATLALLVLTSGHDVNNVFSNISNGLAN